MWEFVRHLFDDRGIAPKSIDGYVSSVVRHARIKQGREIIVPQLYRDWMFRLRQVPRPNGAKGPVSRKFLLDVVTRQRASLATRAAVTMAYFTGMRLGELVAQRVGQYDPMFTVTRGDITFDPAGRFVMFNNRGGKSDVFNRGTKRFLMAAAEGALFCPVRLLRQQWDAGTAAGATLDTPFLQHNSTDPRMHGRMVTRYHVVDLLKRVAREWGIDPTTIGGHSIRISAATNLAEDNVEFADIMMFGGWLTETSCMKYLRWTEARLERMSRALALSPAGQQPVSRMLAMAMAADAQ